MPAPADCDQLVILLRKSGLVDEERLRPYVERGCLPRAPLAAARMLVRNGLLTHFQANHLMQGRYFGLSIGPYQLLDKIGEGGAGMVYLAQQKYDERKVAIKVLPADRVGDREALERFYREGRAVATLSHRNIVRGLEVNCWKNLHYLVMEYVEGKSLQRWLDERGPFSFRQATSYAYQVAAGLRYIHAHHHVHRDIKPSNLLLTQRGLVKILDMGLARSRSDKKDLLTRDHSKGAILGTADFLSPEQAVRCYAVDIRADIYSLGATYFALLVGKPPFHDSKLVEKLIDHQMHMPPAPHEMCAGIPPVASDIIAKMMAKRPEDRYQTPGEVVKVLREILVSSKETLSDVNLQCSSDTVILSEPPELRTRSVEDTMIIAKRHRPTVASGMRIKLKETMRDMPSPVAVK